jgi:hypothetical protein
VLGTAAGLPLLLALLALVLLVRVRAPVRPLLAVALTAHPQQYEEQQQQQQQQQQQHWAAPRRCRLLAHPSSPALAHSSCWQHQPHTLALSPG